MKSLAAALESVAAEAALEASSAETPLLRRALGDGAVSRSDGDGHGAGGVGGGVGGASAECRVLAVDVYAAALVLHVRVRGWLPRPEHDPCASKLVVVRGAAARSFGGRCGLRNERAGLAAHAGHAGLGGALVRPDACELSAELVFELRQGVGSVLPGDELCFEFGESGFSVVSLGRL